MDLTWTMDRHQHRTRDSLVTDLIVKPIPLWATIVSQIVGVLFLNSSIVYVVPLSDGEVSACHSGRLLAATCLGTFSATLQIVFCFIFFLRSCGCDPDREWWLLIHIIVGVLANIPFDLCLFFGADLTIRGAIFMTVCGVDWICCFIIVVKFAFYST